jgi:hypothetical protein
MPSAERLRQLRARTDEELTALTPRSKRCRQCGQDKPGAEFSKDRSKPDGRDTRCRECSAAAMNAYRTAHPDRVAASKRRTHLKHYKTKGRAYRLKAKYGLTAAEYQELFDAQDGRCAICGERASGRANNGAVHTELSVDHDHETGRVRALLCANCNKGLGCLGDDADRVQAAADYLRQHKEIQT